MRSKVLKFNLDVILRKIFQYAWGQQSWRKIRRIDITYRAASWVRVEMGPALRSNDQLLGQNAHFLIVRASQGESYSSFAQRYLGDSNQAWVVSDANGSGQFHVGDEAVVPLQNHNPVGVYREGHQVVPILSYHRIDRSDAQLAVSPEKFSAHLEYLHAHDFTPTTLDSVSGFLRGSQSLPLKSIVITIDDGYASASEHAFPLLKQYNFPATLFVYTDFVGSGGLVWKQIKEMERSGLKPVQISRLKVRKRISEWRI